MCKTDPWSTLTFILCHLYDISKGELNERAICVANYRKIACAYGRRSQRPICSADNAIDDL